MAFSTNFKPPRGSGRLDRKAKKAAEEAALAEAYEYVNVRDGNICRVTGRHVQPGAVMAEVRREHHHLEPRSIAPHRETDPSNIILVCAEAHEYITGHLIHVEGTNANEPVFFFWDEERMKGRIKPFRIVGKRWTAA